jgi:hypothetical protein
MQVERGRGLPFGFRRLTWVSLLDAQCLPFGFRRFGLSEDDLHASTLFLYQNYPERK